MSDIAAIQQTLKDYGFYDGPIDGAFGDKSRRGLLEALKLALAASAAQEPSEDDAALIKELDVDEGVVPYAYPDSEGYLTIGRGRLVDKRKGGSISPAEIAFLTANDLRRVDGDLDRNISWWRNLDPVRRRALRGLCFNMGWGDGVTHGLSTFKNTLAALKAGDYDRAAVGFLTSKWASQVQPSRRDRVVGQIRTGA